MQLDDALAMAWDLLDEHGLTGQGWTVLTTRARSCIGCCVYGVKAIHLSEFHVPRMPDVEVRDTILHEIAHAKVGPNHGHDWAWQAVAQQLGARPQATANCSYSILTNRR